MILPGIEFGELLDKVLVLVCGHMIPSIVKNIMFQARKEDFSGRGVNDIGKQLNKIHVLVRGQMIP